MKVVRTTAAPCMLAIDFQLFRVQCLTNVVFLKRFLEHVKLILAKALSIAPIRCKYPKVCEAYLPTL
jgi:hypothetical protein